MAHRFAGALLALTLVATGLTGGAAATTDDAATADAVPLPTSAAPPTGNGVPFGAAGGLAALAGGSLDLDEHGYVEEELVVSGTANVYRYGTAGVEVATADVPYTTRILVRRPRDPAQFSGNVLFETSHPLRAYDAIWLQIPDYVVGNGDAYVSVTTRRTSDAGTSAIEALEGSDPERYAAIDFPEDGLNWDVMAQVGRLLRTRTADNPLQRYDVERLYAMGWSGAGALWLLYIGEGFPERHRMPDGDPIFDAYLVGEPSGYPQINSVDPAISETDPREQVQPAGVPVITLHTRPQEPHRRRDDANRGDDRYRVYEVGGAAHAEIVFPPIYEQSDDVFALDGPFGCAYEISQFPMHHFFKSTLARLDAWAARGVAPPPSQRIALDAAGTPELDEHGNPTGGVRSTFLDVPTARYFENGPAPDGNPGCEQFGAQERFSPDVLSSLYADHDDYVREVVQRANRLERAGWLLPADARQVRRDAQRASGF